MLPTLVRPQPLVRRFPDVSFQQINAPLQDGTFRQHIRRIGNQLIMRFVAAMLELLDAARKSPASRTCAPISPTRNTMLFLGLGKYSTTI